MSSTVCNYDSKVGIGGQQGVASADGAVLNRTWTISSHPDESAASSTFAITVKKAGLVSSYLHRRAHRCPHAEP